MFETSDTEIGKNGKNDCSGRNSSNNNDDIVANNNYELRFPYSIKSVDPSTDEHLLKDFTGNGVWSMDGRCFLFVYEFREIWCQLKSNIWMTLKLLLLWVNANIGSSWNRSSETVWPTLWIWNLLAYASQWTLWKWECFMRVFAWMTLWVDRRNWNCSSGVAADADSDPEREWHLRAVPRCPVEFASG